MRSRDALIASLAILCLLGVGLASERLPEFTNSTTVSLGYLLVVLFVAALTRLWAATLTSLMAVLCLNFFFLPPLRTFTIADPENWAALIAFLAVSLVASNLSAAVRAREREALDRRDELARLFDVSRDVLQMTETRDATLVLARLVARRFGLGYVAIALRDGARWVRAEQGVLPMPLPDDELTAVEREASRGLEFDAHSRTYAGHRTITVGGEAVCLVPLRSGARLTGLLATAGRTVEPGTLDALAGTVAIAVERVALLEERKSADLARQSEALKSALLASLGHDLRTPLTAIRVAASNLREGWATDEERRDQGDVILLEVERLSRLFQNTLDMARIDASAVSATTRWVHLSELYAAARDQVAQALATVRVHLEIPEDTVVCLDPRLTASALAHVLENAVHYAAEGSAVTVSLGCEGGDLVVRVDDQGPGIAPQDLPHLFERFYRGAAARVRPGTGMGLSIARGLLAAQHGRIWAENRPEGGARFTITVPVQARAAGALS